ncbi:Mitochondrial dicarboxylate transporter [Gonapodya sp. JEL0774]|nr:Mitochondrial dicarboxylate transporter [Gonapodya sp. JEL0774]
MATAVTHPVDLFKVRKQTQTVSTSYAELVRSLVKNEGVFGVYAGLSASLLRQLTYGTARFAVYDDLKLRLRRRGALNPSTQLASAVVAGTIGGIVGNPLDLAMVRMQNDGKLPAADRRGYKWAGDAVFRAIREEGLRRGLFTGLSANIGRAVVVTASQLVSYDVFKATLLDNDFSDSLSTHFGASFLAGLVATTACNPVDVVKSRVMADKTGQYTGFTRVFVKISKEEGLQAFMKGWTTAYLRMAPQTRRSAKTDQPTSTRAGTNNGHIEMAHAFANLCRKHGAVSLVFDAYIEAAREAESARDREYMAAFKIQQAWRTFRDGRRDEMLSRNVTVIQRIFRGHLGRQEYTKLVREREEAILMNLRNTMATRIQRVWRGHISRTNVFSYYARKEYIKQVQRKTQQMKMMLEEEQRRKSIEKQKLLKQAEDARINKLAGRLHHLVGTKAVKGVWSGTNEVVDAVVLVKSKPSPPLQLLRAPPLPAKRHLDHSNRQHPKHHVHDHTHHNPDVDGEYRRSVSHPPHQVDLRVLTHSALRRSKERASEIHLNVMDLHPVAGVDNSPQTSLGKDTDPLTSSAQVTLPLLRIPESRLQTSDGLQAFVERTVGKNWKNVKIKPDVYSEDEGVGQQIPVGKHVVEVKGPFMVRSKPTQTAPTTNPPSFIADRDELLRPI